MIARTTMPQLEIPGEMRAMAERSIEQAKLAFDKYMRMTREATYTFEERVEAGQVGAQEASKKAMSFALANATSAFEFCQKVVQVKDVAEFIRLLNDFLHSQMQMFSDQVKDLGETLSTGAMDSMKDKKIRDLTS